MDDRTHLQDFWHLAQSASRRISFYGNQAVTDQPIVRISPADLDSLLGTLDVKFVALSECVVSSGYQLDMDGLDSPGLHYTLVGTGTMHIGAEPPIRLAPHTLVVVPPKTDFRIEVPADATSTVKTVDGRAQANQSGPIRRFIAGDGSPQLILICGYFRATYGSSTDLFDGLRAPVVERFDESDRLDQALMVALAELEAQDVGCSAMSAALLKQVIVALVRRSLGSMSLWVERFGLLSDLRIARAFASMAAHPGAPHSVDRLAKTAGLSRSAFMVRFTEVTGHPPMRIVRDLRMRQAAQQLRTTDLSIEEIIRNAGYESRSSFVRAFRTKYGRDPSDYRA